MWQCFVISIFTQEEEALSFQKFIIMTSSRHFRQEDKHARPSFSQIKYCLSHDNDRILGKQLKRSRSVTFNDLHEEPFDSYTDADLRCRTS